jgi:steroid delta-isomerase-like uncharacterized protein
MSGEEHKVLVRRFFDEVFNRWEAAAVEGLLARDYRQHDPVRPAPLDREDLKQTYPLFRAAFPDLHFTVEDLVGEGNRVAARYTFHGTHLGTFRGVAPTGRRVTGTGIAIFRLAEGAIAEVWANWDQLGLLQQLGLVPA